MKNVFRLVLLTLAAIQVCAQSAPPTTGLSTDEIIAQLVASRPKGKRTLAMPKLFDALDEKSEEQSVVPTDKGMAAWRDVYGKKGNEEFALRQYFTPIPTWKQKTPKQMLDDAREQMVKGTQAVLVSERDYTLDDCPCRSFVVKQPAGGVMVRLDYLLIYPDLFIVSCSGSDESLRSPQVAKFFAELKTVAVK